MTLAKTFYTITICLFSFSLLGQTGELSISSYSDYYSFTCYLYFGDSLINIKDFENGMSVDFDSLETGNYKLKIIGYEGFRTTLYPIQIRENEITYITVYSPYIWNKKLTDTLEYNKNETSFNFLTNLNSNDISSLLNRNYQLSCSKDVYLYRTKHLSWGILTGSSFSYTDFQNDSHYYNITENIKNERYFNWNLDVTLIGRISTFDMRKDYKKGGYFDIGISYHFPFLFRHVYNIKNRKYITKKLHNYKNVTPLFRIGYNNLAITYQYQLLDYIKSTFPQNPKHTIGLTFIIDE